MGSLLRCPKLSVAEALLKVAGSWCAFPRPRSNGRQEPPIDTKAVVHDATTLVISEKKAMGFSATRPCFASEAIECSPENVLISPEPRVPNPRALSIAEAFRATAKPLQERFRKIRDWGGGVDFPAKVGYVASSATALLHRTAQCCFTLEETSCFSPTCYRTNLR